MVVVESRLGCSRHRRWWSRRRAKNRVKLIVCRICSLHHSETCFYLVMRDGYSIHLFMRFGELAITVIAMYESGRPQALYPNSILQGQNETMVF